MDSFGVAPLSIGPCRADTDTGSLTPLVVFGLHGGGFADDSAGGKMGLKLPLPWNWLKVNGV